MLEKFKALVIDNQSEKFSRDIKEISTNNYQKQRSRRSFELYIFKI